MLYRYGVLARDLGRGMVATRTDAQRWGHFIGGTLV